VGSRVPIIIYYLLFIVRRFVAQLAHESRLHCSSIELPLRPLEIVMKRATRLLATLGLLSIPSLLLAQNPQSPSLPSSAEIFGPELIAWSQQQKPQPVLQLPEPRERQQEVGAANAEAQQQPALQTVEGRIVKKRSQYVLQVSKRMPVNS